MPLFSRHKLLFIHIPKCGGDTISFALSNQGDKPFLFVADGSVMVNGHSPQHATWRELLKLGWSTRDEYRVAALVRHPIDRVLSAFRYIHHFRKDLLPFAETPAGFLDNFLSKETGALRRFDNHNKSILDFLINEDGVIDSIIHIRPLNQIELWLSELQLPQISVQDRRNVTSNSTKIIPEFSNQDIQKIKDFYQKDISWYEQNFPNNR